MSKFKTKSPHTTIDFIRSRGKKMPKTKVICGMKYVLCLMRITQYDAAHDGEHMKAREFIRLDDDVPVEMSLDLMENQYVDVYMPEVVLGL